MTTESIEVRPARLDEAERIAQCLALAFEPFRLQYTDGAFQDTVPGPEAIRQRMAEMTVYVAAAPDGTILGTLASGFAEHEGHLRGMAVRPGWQGHRLAQQLLTKAEDDLMKAGCERITLDTTLPLQRAILFYKKNGFTPSGRTRDFFGMPLYEYVKYLRSTSSSGPEIEAAIP